MGGGPSLGPQQVGLFLVEVDEDTAAYDKGHIQGAIKLDWTMDLQDQVRRDFVNKAQFEALLSSRGVANDDTIVLYGGNNNWFAAYAYWYFKLYGHDDVKLLDGGRKKWSSTAASSPTSCRSAPRPPTPRRTRTCRSAPTATRSWPQSARRTSSTCARPTSTPVGCSPPPTSRRSRRSAPVTSRPPRTCRGARPPTTTGPSSPMTSSRSSTPTPGSTGARTRSPTAASVSARRTRGSCSGAAGPAERQELRRLLDRVRLPGRRPRRPG